MVHNTGVANFPIVRNLQGMGGGLHSRIAMQAAEHYVRTGGYLPIPQMLPRELAVQKACVVSIIQQPGRHVRGSFGTPLPRSPILAQEIITNTVEAIVRNNIHMRPIDASSYRYAVGVFGPLERITSKEHLKPLEYGLYVRSDKGKTALLLPRRVGIETADDQIATAIREARIDSKNEDVTMYRFSVTFYD